MTFTVLRSTGQIFCRKSLSGFVWCFSHDLVGDISSTSYHRYYILFTWLIIFDVKLDCLAVVVFVKFLHCKVAPPSHLFFFLIFKFILFLAVLGLRCGAWASHCGGFSCCRAQALGMQASVVVAHRLSSCGSWVLELRLSSCGAWA